MLKSMTGFGRSEQSRGAHTCKVEVRSVNNRFLEVHARLPKALSTLEPEIKNLVKAHCARGSIDIHVTLEKENGGSAEQEVTPNLELANQYVTALNQLQTILGLKGAIDINSLLALRDIVRVQPVDLGESGASLVLESIGEALRALVAMRAEEGRALRKDLEERIECIRILGRKVRDRQPAVLEEYRARLKEKIRALTDGNDPDPARIAQEVALLADRCDIAEETTRLESHLGQFKNLLTAPESQGRKLEFIMQEINREANTAGAKSTDFQIAQWVIEIKSTLEKIREQLQNIE